MRLPGRYGASSSFATTPSLLCSHRSASRRGAHERRSAHRRRDERLERRATLRERPRPSAPRPRARAGRRRRSAPASARASRSIREAAGWIRFGSASKSCSPVRAVDHDLAVEHVAAGREAQLREVALERACRRATGSRPRSRPRTRSRGSRRTSARRRPLLALRQLPRASARAAAGSAARAAASSTGTLVCEPSCRATTAPTTSAAPTAWSVPSDSPSSSAARPTPTTVSKVERMLAVPGPTRGSASRNEAIGTTVQMTASRPIATQPPDCSAVVSMLPVAAPKLIVPMPAPGRHQRREEQPVDARDEAVGEQHVGRVGDGRRPREHQARAAEGAELRAAEDERGAGDRHRQRDGAAAVGPFTAERDGCGDDEHRVGREQHRDERGVEPLERGEVEARLAGVGDGAEQQRGERDPQRRERGTAPGRRAPRAGPRPAGSAPRAA